MMKQRISGLSFLKTVFTVFLCLSFSFGLTQQSHAALQIDNDTPFVTSAVTDGHHSRTAKSDAAISEEAVFACVDHSQMNEAQCADECCDSICQSFIAAPSFAPVKLQLQISAIITADVFRNRTVAPLPFPPRN